MQAVNDSNTNTVSDKGIDVMYFLFEHPTSSEKAIKDGVTSFSDVQELRNELRTLQQHGLLMVHMDALYQLTDLGRVLIGKLEANAFLATDMVRRKLPKAPLARPFNYAWGDKCSALFDVKTLKDTALSAWCFLPEEYQQLKSPNDQTSSHWLVCAKRLEARKLLVKVGGVFERTPLGEQLLQHPERAVPANTHWLGLSRYERLVLEVMLHRADLTAARKDMAEFLMLHNESAERKDIQKVQKALEEKGLLLYRTNKVFYVQTAALSLMGMRKYTPDLLDKLPGLPDVEALKAKMAVFTSAVGATVNSKGKPATPPTEVTKPLCVDVEAGDGAVATIAVKQSSGETLELAFPLTDAVASFPTGAESAEINEQLLPTTADDFLPPAADDSERWFQNAMQALSGFEVREASLPPPKIKGATAKAAFLSKLASMFEGSKGEDVRNMLELVSKDFRELASWQSAQKKR